jgi:hypothetical protein
MEMVGDPTNAIHLTSHIPTELSQIGIQAISNRIANGAFT